MFRPPRLLPILSRLAAPLHPALLFAALLAPCATGAAAAGAESAASQPYAARAERGALLAGPTLARIEMGPFSSAKRIEPELLSQLLDRAGEDAGQAIGQPRCTITTYTVRYRTVGGSGEATDASAALILPSGRDSACKGPRPLLLYAHGTSISKSHDMARLRGEARLVAAMFTAQGYIVVAPNYAGYEGSSLPYHPYLNAEQQSADMVDALRASRAALAKLKVQAAPRLFLAGYSQGGFVTLATQRAMQQEYGSEFQVTAAAGLSGPYAMAQMADDVFAGKPNAGITVYLPLIGTSAQRSGAAIYATPGELYESQYASGIETLLPGSLTREDLFKRGKLPARALFASDSQPQADGSRPYFADPHLVRSSYRAAYLQDMAEHPCSATPGACPSQNNLRRWMLKNDLRNYRPQSPLLLCGAAHDPAVPFYNATAAASYFRTQGALPVLLDLEAQAQQDEYSLYRQGFARHQAAVRQQAQQEGRNPDEAVAERYHARLAAPFCLLAARAFFDKALLEPK
ncbi:S9 family peptidase [Massilia sp. NR 4-1]|uniref:alpha/beta hydrolase family protein n=1 Tax=Massilia sp. NR 4-1 TaxID=1678028 RepID=UPI0009E50085|nr:prolyl oligopeptidase family serine peptidase [Massilia sp. NR 4-1]